MPEIFIPGFATEITLGGDDFTIVGNVLTFNRARAALPKPVFGQKFRNELSGQGSGTLSADGHLSVASVPLLEAMYESADAVPYIIQAGELGEGTDAGLWTGELVITQLDISTDAENEWEWSLAGNLNGAPLYTPPVP